MIASAIIAEMANHAEHQPWPSLEWAGWIFDKASFVLVGSLVAGCAATAAIVWMGIVKEHHWDLLREHAGEKIASVELRAANLNKEAEQQRAKNLRLQRAIQPRRIAMGGVDGDNEVRAARFAEVASHPMTAYLVSVPDFESNILASDIASALKKSGWNVESRPAAISPGLILPGVHIVTLQDPPRVGGEPPRMEMPAPTEATRAADALFKLLVLDLGPPNGPGLGVMPERDYRGMESTLRGSPITLDDHSLLICVGMKPVPSPDAPSDPPLKFE
jgi:hypothetical protein